MMVMLHARFMGAAPSRPEAHQRGEAQGSTEAHAATRSDPVARRAAPVARTHVDGNVREYRRALVMQAQVSGAISQASASTYIATYLRVPPPGEHFTDYRAWNWK